MLLNLCPYQVCVCHCDLDFVSLYLGFLSNWRLSAAQHCPLLTTLPRHTPNFRTVLRFRFGHRKWLFWSEEKQWKWLFLTLKTGTSGARNENLRPVLKFRLWRGYVVRNSLTFGYWKVVFSLFLILYRAFSQVRKPHVLPISQEENGPIMIPKTVLKSGLWRGR